MKKVYVQELIAQQAEFIGDAIVNKKGYVYICGDAKHSESSCTASYHLVPKLTTFVFAQFPVAREVESQLEDILGKVKGGERAEGAKELKALKDRNRLLMDVWS